MSASNKVRSLNESLFLSNERHCDLHLLLCTKSNFLFLSSHAVKYKREYLIESYSGKYMYIRHALMTACMHCSFAVREAAAVVLQLHASADALRRSLAGAACCSSSSGCQLVCLCVSRCQRRRRMLEVAQLLLLLTFILCCGDCGSRHALTGSGRTSGSCSSRGHGSDSSVESGMDGVAQQSHHAFLDETASSDALSFHES